MGWCGGLHEHGVGYQDLRSAVLNGEPIEEWVAGERSWADLLAATIDVLAVEYRLDVAFEGR